MANENNKYEQLFRQEAEARKDGSITYPQVYICGEGPSFVGELGLTYRITVEILIPEYMDEPWQLSSELGDTIISVETRKIIATGLTRNVAERMVKDHNQAVSINRVRGEYYRGSR